MDKSPLTGIPCAAPCWYGLEIGKSSESDVMSILPTLTFINRDSVQLFREGLAPGGLDPADYNYEAEIVANCIYQEKQCLLLRTKNYLLTKIEVSLNYEVTLEQAIGYLGEPDYIGYLNTGAERILCEIDVVWRSKLLVLASKVFEGHDALEKCDLGDETGKAKSDLVLSVARYESQEAIEILLSAGTNKFFEFSGTIPDK